MKIPWQRIRKHPKQFWGAAGALAAAVVLLLLSVRNGNLHDFTEPAGLVPTSDVFSLNDQTSLFTIPTNNPEELAIDADSEVSVNHITLADAAMSTTIAAYKSNMFDILQPEYIAVPLPTTPEGEQVLRILYQSVPYLTAEEVRALMAQKRVGASELTMEDIIAATQLAIAAVAEETAFDFTDADIYNPNVKPLYDYYVHIPADTPASSITFAFDTKSAMWSSGTLYGPIKIVASVDGYAHNTVFDLQAQNLNREEFAFKTADNKVITGITPGEPFYLQIYHSPDQEVTFTLSAIATSVISNGGEALCLSASATPSSDDVFALALRGPIPTGALFSSISERNIPIVDAYIRLTPALEK